MAAETGKDASLAVGDPLLGLNFGIEISGKISGYFHEIGGLESSNEVVEMRGQDAKGKEIIRKIPGKAVWGDLVLKQGITTNLEFWKWRQEVVDGKMHEARRDFSITMYDHQGTEMARWNFTAGWPSKVSGPSLNAGGNEVGVEELTITHEGIRREK